MRLDGLFVVDACSVGRFYQERVSCKGGMLYELADVDWDDPDAAKNGPVVNGTEFRVGFTTSAVEQQWLISRNFISACHIFRGLWLLRPLQHLP